MATISELLALAVQRHQGGQLQAAEQLYRQILSADPNHADALHLLGVIALQEQGYDAAEQFIRRAIALDATESSFHVNLGNTLQAQGKLNEAVVCFRRAVDLRPDDPVAHYDLANALQAQGKLAEAVASYRRAIFLHPDYAVAYNNLGRAFAALGKLNEADESYRRARQLDPTLAAAQNLPTEFPGLAQSHEAIGASPSVPSQQQEYADVIGLGNALQIDGKYNEAVACFRRAVTLSPADPIAHFNLGNALQAQRKLDEAIACYNRAIELNPDFHESYNNLGAALQARGNLDEAIAVYDRALQRRPNDAKAHNNLGIALKDQMKHDAAVASLRRAIQLEPDYSKAHCNLGAALQAQGKLDEATASFTRALELNPGLAEAHSNLLCTLHFRGGVAPSDLFTAHAEFDQRHAVPLRPQWRPHDYTRDPDRPLRLGFVSPDFGQHPVGSFVIRALENLDHEQCTTVCYSDRIVKDQMTSRFQSACATWREVSGWSDLGLAERIRADQIDILFDLAGHTAKNRLLVFARKPAPLQVTWAGYVGTTGLTAMDYILADRFEIPPASEEYHSERALQMPDGYVCYDPPADAPPVSSLPAQALGYVTFGSLNNPAKINADVIEAWAAILKRVPQSRLTLKSRGQKGGCTMDSLVSDFGTYGIEPQRIVCLDWLSQRQLLAEYNRIDLALDTFPYNGGLTTCEALWMGVPVITCPGETFASRHSLSHLSNIGLTETIARNLDDYVERAVFFATELPRLAVLRAGLRARMTASPLCDGQRFAENLMRKLREAWALWCREPPSGLPRKTV